jgi:hypothetical protein
MGMKLLFGYKVDIIEIIMIVGLSGVYVEFLNILQITIII